MLSKCLAGLCIATLLALTACTHVEHYHLATRVSAKVETEPVPSTDDAADDPAIWVAPNPVDSLIIGTDKGSGLLSYTLTGQQVQYLPVGKVNNVDLRSGSWGASDLTLLAATQRDPSRLLLFTLDHTSRRMALVASHETELVEPYGTCMFQHGGQPYLIANGKSGKFVQYEVGEDFGIAPVRRWKVGSQPEGCVADDISQTLYIGEEEVGVWMLNAAPDAPAVLKPVDMVGNGALVADVEGLTLYRSAVKTLLVVSSQGDNSFAVYDTATLEHLFSFHVAGDSEIDGASETDGLAATAASLPGFPEGLLVVQDGYNLKPQENQNFKFVSWKDVRLAGD